MAALPEQKTEATPRVIRPLSLRANFSWTFFGNIIYAGCQWAVLVVLAKLGTPEMLGQFTLGTAVTAPIVLFANAQLRLIQATDSKNEYSFGEYLGQRLLSTLLALVLILGIAILSNYPSTETTLVIIIIGIAKSFEAISDIYYGLFQHYDRMDRISRSLVIRGVLALAALSLGVLLTRSVVVGVLCMTVVWVLNLFLYDIPTGITLMKSVMSDGETHAAPVNIREKMRPVWSRKTVISLTWLILPLGIVALLNSLIPNTPRYVIESKLGVRELGFFASMAYLLEISNTLVIAMGQSAAAPLGRYYSKGNYRGFFNLTAKMVGILLVLSVIELVLVKLFGRQILTLLYTPEYADNADVYVTLIIASSVINVASFLGYVMTATRYLRSQVIISGATLVGTTVASLYFIPLYGLQGAAYALIISGSVRLVGSAVTMVHAYTSGKPPAEDVEGVEA